MAEAAREFERALERAYQEKIHEDDEDQVQAIVAIAQGDEEESDDNRPEALGRAREGEDERWEIDAPKGDDSVDSGDEFSPPG